MDSTNTSYHQTSISWIQDYAELLVQYCLSLKKGEKLFVKTSDLALPLLRELFKKSCEVGAICQFDIQFEGQNRIFYEYAHEELLDLINPVQNLIVDQFDAYLVIRAPYNLFEDKGLSGERIKKRSSAAKSLNQKYMQRTSTGDLKRSLCQFPTHAAAQQAGMSLQEYTAFIINACKLNTPDPKSAWETLGQSQQEITDYLNRVSNVQYKGPEMDVQFSVSDRTWINSDGRTNMPSGEVYSAPIENSVNGYIKFDYPSMYMGQAVEEVELWITDGVVQKWNAKQGKDLLDKIFSLPGATQFGEVAIGLNYNITQATKNILFDEKIGGSIHMALGQSYPQCGGKNNSPIHWDMIADMTRGGEIYADGSLIYQNGKFII